MSSGSCVRRSRSRPRRRCARASTRAGSALAVCQMSSSGYSCRPRPSMFSSVFCSRISCGWIAHVEAPRDVEQAQQHGAEGDVLQRLVEDRLAASCGSPIPSRRRACRRHPAGFDVQHRDAPVVAVEHGQEVLGEVVLVARVERADDAEVDRGVARARGVVGSTKMLPGCMSAWKKLWRNTCVKKIFTPFSASSGCWCPPARSFAMSLICTPWMRSITITFDAAPVPVDLGHIEQSPMPAKLRFSCAALAASRIRSSSSRMVFSYSSTTSTDAQPRAPRRNSRRRGRPARAAPRVALDEARACRGAAPSRRPRGRR
jgi:hypothetical protein